MKCIEITEFGDPEVLKLASCQKPSCRSGELLIEVAAAGVNRPDVVQRMGNYAPPPGASELPGLEVAGTVVVLGEDVTGWQVGDQVCALSNGGGYAEYVSVPAGQCLPVPQGLSLIEAAGLPETFFTVWNNLFQRGRLKQGETVLIHGGSSGIGVAAIQMAVAMGANVFVTAGSEAKCRACEQLGASLAINYRQADFVQAIKDATNKRGVDVILDMVGGDYLNKNIKIAAVEGRIVNIAFQHGFEVTVNFGRVLMKRLSLMASTLRAQSETEKVAIAVDLKETIWPLVETGAIRSVVAEVFPLAQAADAHRLMESSQHIGKIILTVKP